MNKIIIFYYNEIFDTPLLNKKLYKWKAPMKFLSR